MAQAKKKANSVLTSEFTADGTIVINVLGAGKVEFNPANVNVALRQRAELHGWLQRLSDGAALSRDPETGESPTAEAKLERIQAIAAHYLGGAETWAMRAGSGDGAGGNLTLRAIARVYGYDLATAGEKLDALATKKGMDRKALMTLLRGNEKVKAAIDAIRAESTKASNVDTEALLGELAGDELEGDEQA